MARLTKPLRLLRQYGGKSVFRRNWLIVLAVTLTPVFLLSGIVFSMIQNAYRRDIDTRCLRQAERYALSLQNSVQRSEELLAFLSNYESVRNLSQATVIDTLWYPHLDWTLQTLNLFNTAMRYSDDTDLLMIYFETPDKVIDSRGYSLMRVDYGDHAFIDRYFGQPYEKLVLYGKGLRVVLGQPLGIGYAHPVWLAGNIGMDRLRELLLAQTQAEPLIGAWLQLRDARLVLMDSNLQAPDIVLSPGSGHASVGREFLVYAQVGRTDMTCVLRYDARALYADLNRYGALLIGSIVLLCAMALYFSLLIAERVTAPIHLLVQRMSPDTEGFPVGGKFEDLEEIRRISETYRGSLDENKLLRMSLEERRTLLRQAQLTALEYQVHPHMIHNALESINWAVRRRIGLDNPISTAIVELGELLRFGLEDAGQLITMRQEMEQLQNYIRLQQFQHPNALDVVWEVDEGLMACAIIKLSVQPLVENALKHATVGDRTLSLTIRAGLEEDCILLLVRDNGAGIAPEALEGIRAELKAPAIAGLRHLGLMNVHLRYRLLFGERYGLEIESLQGSHTIVTLCMPCIRNLE